MKKLALAALTGALLLGASINSASAANIGVTMALFDDNFLTVLRNGIQKYADDNGHKVQIEDAKNDVSKQLDQINNFIASGVDAIIVNPVDTSATQAMTDAAAKANIPLVYVNRQPINLDTLPANQAFVASNEKDSGTLETKQICANFKAAGKTEDVHDVIGGPDCGVKVNIIDEQTANWSRDKAQDLMTNWLSTNKPFDGVISNNDEMAIGAIQAMKAAGIDMKTVQVGGVDATQDALAAMQAGDLDVTVFQNAAAQGSGSVDAAAKLAKGEKVDRAVWVPFELVTPENIQNYLKKN